MKITFKGDYALKIILDLALQGGAARTQMKELAARQDIPLKFLEQIGLTLKKSGYIETVRGPKGGIRLAKAPGKITVGEIVRLIEGPTSPIGCVCTTAHTPCDFERRCAFKPMWQEVNNRINEVIDTTTFADLAKKTEQIQNTPGGEYSI
jgi:Rrf2 family transcriptional regulator, cysteine metabolism repressor